MHHKMTKQQSSYRQIMKATSLFGGVQVFQIIIQIIRSKVIAILLGPAGMGIIGLLTSSIGLIGGLTNFGLGVSAVKNIAEAKGTGNKSRIATVVVVVRRLVWITGLLGAIITIIISPWLSQITFGNRDYTFAFVFVSITLLFNQLSSGQLVLLQGMRKLQYLAKANLYGSFLGLLITVPLYFKFGVDGIVPGIIIVSFISLSFSWFFARKIKIEPIKVDKAQTITESKSMIKLGFMISISGLIALGASYLVRIFISHSGSLDDVGLYNAGFAVITTYVGLVFTAMATDYYPRLSAISHDNLECKKTINQQAEIALLILAPIITVFLVFIDWGIILLYSTEFISINVMMYWAAIGMFFKAASWAIAFVFLAKGASKLFFWSELIVNIYILIFNLIGYHYLGLTGLGISFLLGYLFYFIQVYLIAKKKYEFSFESEFVKIFVLQFALSLCCFLTVKFIDRPYAYFIGAILIAISGWYSYKELDKRLGLKQVLLKIKEKLKLK